MPGPDCRLPDGAAPASGSGRGARGPTPFSALRLGLSARSIAEALAGAGPQAVTDRALAVLDRVAGLAASTPSYEHSDDLHHA